LTSMHIESIRTVNSIYIVSRYLQYNNCRQKKDYAWRVATWRSGCTSNPQVTCFLGVSWPPNHQQPDK